MTAFYKGERQVFYVFIIQHQIQVRVGKHKVKILNRHVVIWALVLNDIHLAEDLGDVLFDGNIGGFLDNYDINPQRLSGKLVLGDKLQGVAVLVQFQLYRPKKSRMPSDSVIAAIRIVGILAVGVCTFAVCFHRVNIIGLGINNNSITLTVGATTQHPARYKQHTARL
jgi:hypothetical protein